MHLQGRREGDGRTSKPRLYYRRPNEAHEISKLLKIYLDDPHRKKREKSKMQAEDQQGTRTESRNMADEMRDDRRQWHLDKSVSLSHLLTTITIAVGGAWYIMGMESQIAIGREQLKYMQIQVDQLKNVIGEGNNPLRRDIDRIQTDLTKVNDKLDQLILQQAKPRKLGDYR